MGPRPAEPTTFNGGGGGDGREDNLKENWIRALYWTNYIRGCNPEADLWFARVVEKLRVDPFLDSCELEIDQSPLGQFLVGARMNSLDLAILMGDLWMVLMILRRRSIRDIIIRGPIQDLSRNRKFLQYTPIYDANTRSGILYTPLHLAVEGENSLIVAALLERGADVNAQNWQGDTPLDLVCKKENFRMLEQLLANDTKEKKSPFHVAVRLGDVDLVRKLPFVKNVNAVDHQQRMPLHLAVEGGHGDIVDVLLEKGVDVNAQNWQGDTPLHLACKKRNVKMLEQLLAKDTKEKKGPFHVAVRLGDVDLMRRLPFVINVNAVDHQQRTPLHLAVEGGHSDIVGLLLEKGADVNAQNWLKQTPLLLACMKRNVQMLEQLLAKDTKGTKPIHVAVEHGDIELIQNFFSLDVNAVDIHKRTALHYLARKPKFPSSHVTNIVKVLAQDKAFDINALDRLGHTAFYEAVLSCNTQFVIALLDSFKDHIQVNEICNIDHGTPIQIAFEGGYKFREIERVLMQNFLVKDYIERLHSDRQVCVDATNTILVGAALIASVTFASWLQPPLNYTSYSGEGYSSSSSSDLKYVDVEHNIALRAFWVFNALSFYFAIATVVSGARSVVPRNSVFIKRIVEKLRINLLVTSIFLVFSVLFVIIAFAIAGTIVLTPLVKYQWCMIVPTIIGGMVCIISLVLWIKNLVENHINTRFY